MPTLNPINIALTASQPSRRQCEPVTLGVPFPAGVLLHPEHLHLRKADGHEVALQTAVLDRWKDGTIRWLLVDFQADVDGEATYQLSHGQQISTAKSVGPLTIAEEELGFKISNNHGVFACRPQHNDCFLTMLPRAGGPLIKSMMIVKDEKGTVYVPDITEIEFEHQEELRTELCLKGSLRSQSGSWLADLFIRLHFFAGSTAVKMDVTIRNSRKADHPGGLWDLGNAGSIYLRDASITFQPSIKSNATGTASLETGQPFRPFQDSCKLFQDSSGGENWKSTNHLNRQNKVPLSFQGYQATFDGEKLAGKRATPIVSYSSQLAIASNSFWQNFPKALEAMDGSITYRLFPEQSADVHEIQGGEQKSHDFTIAFGPDTVTEQPLEWCRSPVIAKLDPVWYSHCGVVLGLTTKVSDPHQSYLQLVDAALQGDDTFAHKREVIDEYGWRHYGDIYGDHEAVFHQGPTPLVSHYNNQYDAIAGLGYQYLRSGDSRWLAEMEAHARHVIDIDIYHTTHDKAAYNHGLFWHTFHYVDACTGTHRSYPKDALVPPKMVPVPGGGPANEQNYSTGLMLHYFLTGYRPSRDAALGLAQWVIDMDDGSKTIFRWLSRGYTGLSSKSRTPEYHGPGRGAANSILVLMDGYRLSQDRKYLEKAEQLIRRCIHPQDKIEKHHLLDAENRWFYTMFLQALARYLHYKVELNETDQMYAYAQAAFLHYARWMTEHEYPYLSKPELLEYPTETWAAQDMRKCEIFDQATLHCTDAERELFRQKAQYFFDYSVETLSKMPTRTLCRPVVLMLNYGFAHNWFLQHPEARLPQAPEHLKQFGQPTVFIPQRQIAVKRAKMIIAGGGVVFLAAVAWLAYYLFS